MNKNTSDPCHWEFVVYQRKAVSQQQALQVTYARREEGNQSYGKENLWPSSANVKELRANAGDLRDAGSIPESGRSPGGAHGNPLQYSCLENPLDTGVWRATVHGVAQSWT